MVDTTNIDPWLLDSYMMHFGIAHHGREVKYEQLSFFDLVVTLQDGSKWLFDGFTNSIRGLPVDSMKLTDEEIAREFKFRFNSMMERHGMTQERLSGMTGIAQCTLSNYSRGTRVPNIINLDKIAKSLNCSVDDFRYL